MRKKRLAQGLTYAGVLPFLCAVVIPIIRPDFLSLDYDCIILTYGAVIASFIAGTHWGIYVLKDTRDNLFIHSNIAALLAWLAVVVGMSISAGLLAACFVYLLFVDKRLAAAGVLEAWYMRMRTIASMAVILALVCHMLLG